MNQLEYSAHLEGIARDWSYGEAQRDAAIDAIKALNQHGTISYFRAMVEIAEPILRGVEGASSRDALEWLERNRDCMIAHYDLGGWTVEKRKDQYMDLVDIGSGVTPLEAIRNAMKENNHD